ncbi:MAG: hypothetical protein ACON4J_03915 [Parvibaculales bacterium]
MIEFFIGLGLFGMTAAMLRKRRLDSRWLALFLLFLPSVYIVFAFYAGDSHALLWEFIYGLPYFAAGLICFRSGAKGNMFVVAGLWALHAFYDFYHERFVINAGVPDWYPLLCFGYDISVCAYLLWHVRGQRSEHSM